MRHITKQICLSLRTVDSAASTSTEQLSHMGADIVGQVQSRGFLLAVICSADGHDQGCWKLLHMPVHTFDTGRIYCNSSSVLCPCGHERVRTARLRWLHTALPPAEIQQVSHRESLQLASAPICIEIIKVQASMVLRITQRQTPEKMRASSGATVSMQHATRQKCSAGHWHAALQHCCKDI